MFRKVLSYVMGLSSHLKVVDGVIIWVSVPVVDDGPRRERAVRRLPDVAVIEHAADSFGSVPAALKIPARTQDSGRRRTGKLRRNVGRIDQTAFHVYTSQVYFPAPMWQPAGDRFSGHGP